jgi:geranylgeranyl diphosphate synthase type II
MHLGIAFQLNDDLLDLYGESNSTGKQIGGDILANKKTFLMLKALEKGRASHKKEIHKLLSDVELDATSKINKIKLLFDELKIKELCAEEASKHTQKAIAYLAKVNASETKLNELKEFATNLLQRVN